MDISRRQFISRTVSGLAAAAAVRAFPFRVYSFPSEVKLVSERAAERETERLLAARPFMAPPWARVHRDAGMAGLRMAGRWPNRHDDHLIPLFDERLVRTPNSYGKQSRQGIVLTDE